MMHAIQTPTVTTVSMLDVSFNKGQGCCSVKVGCSFY